MRKLLVVITLLALVGIVNALPNITVSKSDSTDPVNNGTTLNYSILISNVGNSTAINVTLNETFPENVTFVGSTPAPTVQNVSWFLGNLSNGSSTTVNISVTVNSNATNGSILTNFVNVTYTNGTASFSTSDTETTTVNVSDVTDPSVDLLSPVDAFNSSSTSLSFICNATDERDIANVSLYGNWSGSFAVAQTNSSGANDTNYTFSETLADGDFVWNCQVCDTSNNCVFDSANRSLTVDATSPQFSNVVTSDNTYSFNKTYFINVTITDAHTDAVIITFDGSNTTMTALGGSVYGFNVTDLAAGNYTYSFFANDTLSNSNTGSNFTLEVLQADPTVTLTLDGTDGDITIEAGAQANLSGTAGTSEVTLNLYFNGSLFNQGTTPISNLTTTNTPGAYVVILNSSATQNYTNASASHTLTISDTTLPYLFNPDPEDNTSRLGNASETFNISITELLLNTSTVTLFYMRQGTPSWQNESMTCTGGPVNYSCGATLNLTIFPETNILYYFEVQDNTGNIGRNGTTATPLNLATDRTAPNITGYTPTNNTWTNGSLTSLFTANVTDLLMNTSGFQVIYKEQFAVNWSTQNGTCSEIVYTNYGCSANVDLLTNYIEGEVILYYYNATDYVGLNEKRGDTSSPFQVTIDRTNPTITNLTPTTFVEDQNTNFSVNVTDNFNIDRCILTIGSTNYTMTLTNDTNGSAYTVTTITSAGFFNSSVTCYDGADNQNVTTTVVQATIAPASVTPSTGGGGGASSFYKETPPAVTETPPATYTFEGVDRIFTLYPEQSILFKINDVDHTITLLEITETTAEFEIRSEPINIKLAKAQQTEVDIDKDGIKDILLRLDDIQGGRAIFFVKKIEPEAIEPVYAPEAKKLPPPPTAEVVVIPDITVTPPETKPGVFVTVKNTGILLVLGILAIIVMICTMYWGRIVKEIKRHVPHHEPIQRPAHKVHAMRPEVMREREEKIQDEKRWKELQQRLRHIAKEERVDKQGELYIKPVEEQEITHAPDVDKTAISREVAGLRFAKVNLQDDYELLKKKLKQVQHELEVLKQEKDQADQQMQQARIRSYKLNSALVNANEQQRAEIRQEITKSELSVADSKKRSEKIQQSIVNKQHEIEEVKRALHGILDKIDNIDDQILSGREKLKFHNGGRAPKENQIPRKQLKKVAAKHGVKKHGATYDEAMETRWKHLMELRKKKSN